MFDPADGSLSLRRCEISLRSYEQNLSVPSAVPGIGGTSISLPSRPSFGRVSAPLPAPPTSSRDKSSGVAQAQDKPTEMVGRESEVATWNLRRGRDWPAVKASVQVEGHVSETLSSASSPKYGFTSAPYIVPNVIPSAGFRLRNCEPVPIPHWSFRNHFISPISSLSMPSVMITMAGFADSSLTCSDQRSRCGRRSKSAHMQLVRVKLSYMDRMTPGALHHLSTSRCHRQWPAVLNTRHRHP